MGHVLIAGIAAGVGVTGALVTSAITDPDSVAASIAETVTSARRRGQPVIPSPDMLAQWERKVRRDPSKRSGIQVRPRVVTYPFRAGDASRSLVAYAALCGQALRTTVAGGTIMAVIANIEGGYSSGATYNRNPGNVKLMGSRARLDVTPPCYFLTDNINSFDAYQSFGVEPGQTATAHIADNEAAWIEGIQSNFNLTFAQPRYQSKSATVNGRSMSFRELLDGGYLQQVCAIMGINGYAASYRNPEYMTARY